MEIHVLYILKETGECIYSRIFSSQFENLQIGLISSFFSAFFTFSGQVLSEEIDRLEMGKYKFHFKKEKGYIFALQADITFSNLYLKSCIDKVIEMFFFSLKEKGWGSIEVIEDARFDSVIDEIIFGGGNLLKKIDLYKKVESFFERSMKKNDIIGAALLTSTGDIIHSSLPDSILVNSLKELELRFTSGTTWIPELFYTLKNGQKVFSKQIGNSTSGSSFIVVLLFEETVPLGMAELTLNRVAKDLDANF